MTLARRLAMALDPVELARAAGLDPDGWQADVLRSRHPRSLWNISRQSGKSTTAAIMALHEALFHPNTLVLLVSPGLRQSTELLRKVVDAYQTLDRPVSADAESLLRLELENRSRVIALPGGEEGVRGYSAPRLILFDEASRIPDDLFAATSPMLATVADGRLVAMSTPAGRRGWFWSAWEHGGDLWERVQRTAEQIPRISPAFLAAERATMTAATFRQEYMVTFEAIENAVFDPNDVSAAVTDDLDPLLLPSLRRWREPA